MNTNDTNTTSTSTASGGELRDKFIRTLAGDMEIFEKGGTPGLTPLKSSEPTSSERLIAPSPLEPVADEIEVPKSEVEIPVPEPPQDGVTPGFMEGSELAQENRSETDFSPIPLKTYSGDFRERVEETHASTATILAAEQDAEPRSYQDIPEKSKQNNKSRWYIVSGILLLCVSGIGVYVAYSRYTNSLIPIAIAPVSSIPIFVDTREIVSGTGVTLMQGIRSSISKSLALNTVRLLVLDSTASNLGIFEALKVSTPGTLSRNVNIVGSIAGIVNTNSGQSPFFIFSVSSYSSTFSGMLAWEPVMQKSLGPLFSIYPTSANTVVATTTVATSTTATTTIDTLNPKEGFRDEVVSNHDVRIYRDAQGRSILLYGYWNQATLVIARDPLSFIEILRRLASSHTQ